MKRNKKKKNYKLRKKSCFFKRYKIEYIDYKNYQQLNNFIDFRGRIVPRKLTGTTHHNQKLLAKAIKRSKFMALLSYTNKLKLDPQ